MNALDQLDPRGEFGRIGDRLQELFGISGKSIMFWATATLTRQQYQGIEGKTIREKILSAVLRKEPEVFLENYKKANCSVVAILADTIKAQDPDMYQREVLSQSAGRRELVITLITSRLSCAREVREYLEGNADLTTIYPFRAQLGAFTADIRRGRPWKNTTEFSTMKLFTAAAWVSWHWAGEDTS